MSKVPFYFGIDVGSKVLVAAVEGRRPRSFKHTRGGIEEMVIWVRKVAGDGPIKACMEATGVYGYAVALRLYRDHHLDVCIVNPAQISSFAKAQLRRTKTDGIDARVILAFAQSQHPPLWKPESPETRRLYHLVVTADKIKGILQQWNNRAHSHQYIEDLPPVVKKVQRSLRRSLERQLAEVEERIRELCRKEPSLGQKVDLLSSIPGIGEHSATRILAYGRDLFTTRTRKALTAHAGLAPAQKQSGTSIHGKSRIAKQGDRRLRTALFMPALVAAYHNPILKTFYQRLLDKGKPKMLAVVAVMKKLLLMIQAILKNKTKFSLNMA